MSNQTTNQILTYHHTRIEKEGTGKGPSKTKINRNLLATSLLLALTAGAAASDKMLNNFIASQSDNTLQISWHTETIFGENLHIIGQKNLMDGDAPMDLYSINLTEGYPTLEKIGTLAMGARCGMQKVELTTSANWSKLIAFDWIDESYFKTPEREGTGTPEREGTGTPEREGTGTPEREGTGTPEREGTGTPEREGTGTPEREGTGTPEREGTGTPEREGTGTPEREGTGTPEREGTGAPEREGTGSPEWEGTGGIDPIMDNDSIEVLINLQCGMQKGEPFGG